MRETSINQAQRWRKKREQRIDREKKGHSVRGSETSGFGEISTEIKCKGGT